ncbi:MAG: hypothetical protein Q8J76_10980 [Desulfobulbaceae bacterium]|nr:hypothetical protein [Desulfobulbaceae bacterium]
MGTGTPVTLKEKITPAKMNLKLESVDAADIPNIPAGDIAATDVQAAINELDTEKSGTGHNHALNDLSEKSYNSLTDRPARTITFIIDGGEAAITTGQKGHLEIPFACTILAWTLLADQSGSIIIDVWKDTYANFPPTVADTITGTEKPTLSAAQKNQDTALTTWATEISAGDILAFNVDSVATVQRVTLSLQVSV